MALSLVPMDEPRAERIASWRYPAPYDLYDGNDRTVTSVLDGNHLSVLEDGELVAFVGTGPECAVPGGPGLDAGIADMGMGVAPDRCGQHIGMRAGLLFFETLRMGGCPRVRASVASWNERSIALCLRLGMSRTATFTADSGAEFCVYELELLD